MASGDGQALLCCLLSQQQCTQPRCPAASPAAGKQAASASSCTEHTQPSARQGGTLRRNLLLAGTAGVAGLAAALRLADDGDEARLYSRGPGDPYTAALDAFETEQAVSAAPPDLRILPGNKARPPPGVRPGIACGKEGRALSLQPSMRAWEPGLNGRNSESALGRCVCWRHGHPMLRLCARAALGRFPSGAAWP